MYKINITEELSDGMKFAYGKLLGCDLKDGVSKVLDFKERDYIYDSANEISTIKIKLIEELQGEMLYLPDMMHIRFGIYAVNRNVENQLISENFEVRTILIPLEGAKNYKVIIPQIVDAVDLEKSRILLENGKAKTVGEKVYIPHRYPLYLKKEYSSKKGLFMTMMPYPMLICDEKIADYLKGLSGCVLEKLKVVE
jgi:hypothetical protein